MRIDAKKLAKSGMALALALALSFPTVYSKPAPVKVQAFSGTITDTTKVDADLIPDGSLLSYVIGQLQTSTGKEGTDFSYSDLKKLSGTFSVPADVKDLSGIGYARNITEVDASACQATEIKDFEFNQCSNLKTVKLPAGVTSIGESAFNECTSLEDIDLSHVTRIGSKAFAACEHLTDDSIATLKDTVETLGNNAFNGCAAITEAKVPVITGTGKNTVPQSLYQNCNSLNVVTICDSNLTTIEENAFNKTNFLTFIVNGKKGNILPDSVSSIEAGAFDYSGIPSMNLSNTKITTIKDNCFANSNLSEGFVFPKNVTTIGKEAFKNSYIEDVNMPSSITKLEQGCFEGTYYLKNLVISSNVEEIPVNAFSSGEHVRSDRDYFVMDYRITPNVTISFSGSDTSKVKKIDKGAFNSCRIFNTDFLKAMPDLTSLGDYAFAATPALTMNIPANVEYIGEGCFMGNYNMTKLTFEKGSLVKEITKNCFGNKDFLYSETVNGVQYDFYYACPYLKEVQLPDGLTDIDEYAFANCKSLDTIYGASVTKVDQTIKIPGKVEKIGDRAFSEASSFSTDVGEDPKYKTTKDYGLTINGFPNGGIQKVIIPDSTWSIGDYAFYNNKTMESMTIGTGLKEIPKYMCAECGWYSKNYNEGHEYNDSFNKGQDNVDGDGVYNPEKVTFTGLKELNLTDQVESIGESAFYGCYNLDTFNNGKDFILPSQLTTIGANAFNGCKSMYGLSVNSNLETIGNAAFYGTSQNTTANKEDNICKTFSGLTKVDTTSATSLTEIGDSAFARSNVNNLTIPKTVTQLKNNLCESCSNLRTFSWGYDSEEVAGIGENAFKDCIQLTNITLPVTAVWAKTLFSGYCGRENGLSLIASKPNDTATVVFDQATKLPFYCFTKFEPALVSMSLTDKEDIQNAANIVEMDSNRYVKVLSESQFKELRELYRMGITWETNNLVLYGKEKGDVDLTVTGSVYLHDLNKLDLRVSISQNYSVKVDELPIDEFTMNNSRIVDSILYMNSESTNGERIQAKYGPKNTTDIISWTVEDENAATVSDPEVNTDQATSTVTVKPVNPGITNLVASYGENVQNKLEVRVLAPANKIELSDTKLGLASGDQATLTANLGFDSKYDNVNPAYKDQVLYSSSDEDIATVDPVTGTITAHGSGTVNITAKAVASGRTATCTVAVLQEKTPIDSIEVKANGLEYANGANKISIDKDKTAYITFNVEYLPYPTTDFLEYTVGDESVIKVSKRTSMDNGKASVTIEPVGAGTTTLTIQGGNKKQVVDVEVYMKATGLTLSDQEVSLDVGKTKKVTASSEPAGVKTNLEYSTNNDQVAKVAADGTITAVAKGSCNITAKDTISGKTASCSVKVTEPVKKLSIKAPTGNTKKVIVKKGTSVQLSKFATNLNDTTDTFQFSAKKNKKGSVTPEGLVTAKKPGKFKVLLTAYNGDHKRLTKKITVKVVKKNKKAKKVKIKGKKKVKVGKTLCLLAKFKPAAATSTITWATSNGSVANVDGYGVVTAVAKGKVKITASTDNGKKKTIKIKVK